MLAVAAAAKFHSSLFPTAEDRGELTSSSILEINLSLSSANCPPLQSTRLHLEAVGKGFHTGEDSERCVGWGGRGASSATPAVPSPLEAGWARVGSGNSPGVPGVPDPCH